MKIAYVEDDRDSLGLFSERFRRDGAVCDAFPSAEEALSAVREGSHDALVIDIRLPGLSGIELLARLREKGVHTPCALITAFSSAGLTKQAVNSGANYLLEKPFTYPELKRVLERLVDNPGSIRHWVDRGLARLGLTGREEELARLLLKGLSNGEIARVASLSEKTVKQHVGRIFEKASVSTRSEFFSFIFPA